jgi:hypothetical protein
VKFAYAALAVLFIVSSIFIVNGSALKLGFCDPDDYLSIDQHYQNPVDYFLVNCYGQKNAGGMYRPLSIISVQIDRSVWGINPFGYHLTNLILHSFVACMVFFVSYLLLNNFAVSFSSAMLFGILPVNAEVVNLYTARVDPLMAAFFLLSFYFYVWFSGKNKMWALFVSMFFFILSLFSKETAAALPLILLAYEFMAGRLKARISAIMIYIGLLFAFLALRYKALGTVFGGYGFSITKQLASVIFSPFKLIQLIFLPFIQENVVLYLVLLALVSALVIVALLAFAKRSKGELFYFFPFSWIVIAVLPVINIISIGFDFKASRYWYLPAVGFVWLFSYCLFGVSSRRNYMKRLPYIIFILFYAYSLFYCVRLDREWTRSSERLVSIGAKMTSIAKQYPAGTKVYFWNIPTNYKGLAGGAPFFEKPFYDGPYKIFGYRPDYDSIGNLSAAQLKGSVHYIYMMEGDTFVKSSIGFIRQHDVRRIRDYDSGWLKLHGIFKITQRDPR